MMDEQAGYNQVQGRRFPPLNGVKTLQLMLAFYFISRKKTFSRTQPNILQFKNLWSHFLWLKNKLLAVFGALWLWKIRRSSKLFKSILWFSIAVSEL